MKQKLKIDFHFLFPILLVFVLWIIFYFDSTHKFFLHQYGVWPRSVRGIPGIIAHFFIHGNFSHILSNTISLLVLLLLLFVSYREIAFKVFALMIPITGTFLWLIGRSFEDGHQICHMGASGVIFSLFGFLLMSGLIRKNKMLMALTALVIFLYGYMVWSIFPMEKGISWEGHLSGLVSGILLAVVFRKKGPQPDKYLIHEEEEEDDAHIAEEDKYWLLAEHEKNDIEEQVVKPQPQEKSDQVFINYTFVPKPEEKKDDDK